MDYRSIKILRKLRADFLLHVCLITLLQLLLNRSNILIIVN